MPSATTSAHQPSVWTLVRVMWRHIDEVMAFTSPSLATPHWVGTCPRATNPSSWTLKSCGCSCREHDLNRQRIRNGDMMFSSSLEEVKVTHLELPGVSSGAKLSGPRPLPRTGQCGAGLGGQRAQQREHRAQCTVWFQGTVTRGPATHALQAHLRFWGRSGAFAADGPPQCFPHQRPLCGSKGLPRVHLLPCG